MKWLVATVVALFLFAGVMPFLRRFGIGRLPGDINFRLRGREVSIPIASTLLLSLLAGLVARLF